MAEAVCEPLWELLLRSWIRTSFEVKIRLRIAPPYSYSLETRLQQGLLWGVCEALRVWKRIAEWASSYHQTQQASTKICLSTVARCWSKVVWNTIKGESSFRITATNFFFFPGPTLKTTVFIHVFLPGHFGYDWNWLFLELDSSWTRGFYSSLCLTLGYRHFRKQMQSYTNNLVLL